MCDVIFQEIKDIFYKENNQEIDVVLEYFETVFNYTVFNGKQNRAKAVVEVYKILTNHSESDGLKLAYVIGCCIEILQASFLIHDDIMDNSQTRRNKRCWYLISKENNHGLIAINDGLHLNTIINRILKHYFKKMPYYVELIELFNETIYHTCSGQCLDMLTASSNKLDWDNFTEARCEAIARYKTAYYSFNLPVASAMILAGEDDENVFEKAKNILLKIGTYFQVQDDYLDFYGNVQTIGKIGRDIEEGKCSWLVIQALNLANDSQISKLKENYGKEDLQNVEVVRNLYKELRLDEVYLEYEKETYSKLMGMINNIEADYDNRLPKEIFINLLNHIYKRNN